MRTQQREHRGNRRRRRRCGDGGRWPVRRTLVFIFFFFFLAAIVEEEEARVCFYPIISHWLFFYQIRTEREREKEIRSCAEFGSVEGRKKKKKKITPGNELRHAPAPYGRRRHDGTDLDTSASRLRVTFSFTVWRKLAAPLGIGLYVSLECVYVCSFGHTSGNGRDGRQVPVPSNWESRSWASTVQLLQLQEGGNSTYSIRKSKTRKVIVIPVQHVLFGWFFFLLLNSAVQRVFQKSSHWTPLQPIEQNISL